MVGRGRGGGRGKGSSSNKAGARGGLSASFVASTNSSLLDIRQSKGIPQSHLSLSDEARNTERQHSWNSDLRLRHSRVAFISAGKSTAENLNPIIRRSKSDDEATESSFQEKTRTPFNKDDTQSTTSAVVPDGPMSNMTLNDLQYPPFTQAESEGLGSISKGSNVEQGVRSAEASNGNLFTDPKSADEPVYTSLRPPIIRRSPSLAGSNSSGEVIVFAGRRHSCIKGDQKHNSDIRPRTLNEQGAQIMSETFANRSFRTTVKNDQIDVGTERLQSSPNHRPSNLSPLDLESASGHLSGNLGVTASKSGRRRRARHLGSKTNDEAVLDDYVGNLRDGGCSEAFVESSMLNQRDLGGSDTAEWQDEVESLTNGPVARDRLINSEDWDSAGLEGFDELSTSSEPLDSIEQILSKRERPSGVQYLVIGAGCTVDDARWFSISSLNIPGAETLIQAFEDKAELNRPFIGNKDFVIQRIAGWSDASLNTDERMAQDLQDSLTDQEEEINLADRRKARMTDEHLARLLSKQEALELGSNDLMLSDVGDVGTDSEEDLRLDGLWERAMTHRTPSRSKSMTQTRSSFPSATAFADVLDDDPYNGFDIMDQERLSLRKRLEGRRGKLHMQLSDSELEQSIHTAWEKDRTKKKMRKQERKELRAQGLLGKRTKLDLKARYSGGISMTEVKEEIRSFLLSSMESLPLPPMAQGQRKMVHEIANVFNLKSKSTGGGKSRYPVLYKTSRTIQYDEEALKAAEFVLYSGRFLPRIARGKRKGAVAGRGHLGGATSAGVSYRDGEVVGAAAPEIGQENRGRTMLERMGWSTGTALGALNNNRGLVQPVAQVIKTSRSGLG